MRVFSGVLFVIGVLAAAPASAQVVNSLDPSQTYLAVIRTGGNLCFANGFCVQANQGVPVSIFGNFATTSNLTDATNQLSAQIAALSSTLNGRIDGLVGALAGIGTLNDQITNLGSQLNSQLGSVNARLTSIDARIGSMSDEVSRAFELIAVSAALKDAIPNPGDRYAIRLNAAGISGEFAGAVGVSVDAGPARVSFDFGRGRSQSIASGGLNFSFH